MEGVFVLLTNIPRSGKILRLAALRLSTLFRLPQPEAKVKASKDDRSYMEMEILFRLPQPEAKVKVSNGDRSYMEEVFVFLQIYPARAF